MGTINIKIRFSLKHNLFLYISQILLFFGIGFIGIYFLPDCIYPFGDNITSVEKAVFGDLAVYVASSDFGLVDYGDIPYFPSELQDTANSYTLPQDPSFFERIQNIKGVAAILKRQIPLADNGFRLEKIDPVSNRSTELFPIHKFYVGYDFDGLNAFY